MRPDALLRAARAQLIPAARNPPDAIHADFDVVGECAEPHMDRAAPFEREPLLVSDLGIHAVCPRKTATTVDLCVLHQMLDSCWKAGVTAGGLKSSARHWGKERR